MKAKQFKRILLLVLMIISIMVPMLLLSSDGQVSALPGRFTPHFALAISGSGTKNDPYLWGSTSETIVPVTIMNSGSGPADTFVIYRVDCPPGYTYRTTVGSLSLNPGETGTFYIKLVGGADLKSGQTQEADYTVYIQNQGEPTTEVHNTIYTICMGGGQLNVIGNLTGIVIDKDTKVGIVGATVEGNGAITSTDAQGHFLLEGVQAGNNILITTSGTGYKNTDKYIDIPDYGTAGPVTIELGKQSANWPLIAGVVVAIAIIGIASAIYYRRR